jgi:ribonuclease HI
MASSGFYVVFTGAKPGIYNTWQECEAQIHCYPGAKHKKYSTLQKAEQAYREGPDDYYKLGLDKSTSCGTDLDSLIDHSATFYPIETALCVHVKVNHKTGNMEYVYDWNCALGNKLLKRFTTPCRVKGLSQNLADFDALVNGLIHLTKFSEDYPIYTENDIVTKWLEVVGKGQIIYGRDREIALSDPAIKQLIREKVNWLRNNPGRNSIKKWNIRDWGKSPAATNKGYTL